MDLGSPEVGFGTACAGEKSCLKPNQQAAYGRCFPLWHTYTKQKKSAMQPHRDRGTQRIDEYLDRCPRNTRTRTSIHPSSESLNRECTYSVRRSTIPVQSSPVRWMDVPIPESPQNGIVPHETRTIAELRSSSSSSSSSAATWP